MYLLGKKNIYIGCRAGFCKITESNNIALGHCAGSAVEGSSNVTIGNLAGKMVCGDTNVMIGVEAGKGVGSQGTTNDHRNVIIGLEYSVRAPIIAL